MRIQRYVFAALLAALLWPILLYFFDPVMFDLISIDWVVGTYLAGGVMLGTILGIWTIDALAEWSHGKTPLFGWQAAVTRAGIGVVAASIFSIWFWKLLQHLGMPIPLFEIVKTRALTVVAAVWIAAQIVDLLKRDPAPPPRRKR